MTVEIEAIGEVVGSTSGRGLSGATPDQFAQVEPTGADPSGVQPADRVEVVVAPYEPMAVGDVEKVDPNSSVDAPDVTGAQANGLAERFNAFYANGRESMERALSPDLSSMNVNNHWEMALWSLRMQREMMTVQLSVHAMSVGVDVPKKTVNTLMEMKG